MSIYDVRAPTTKPTLESSHTSGKHSDPVWKLQWVERGGGGGGGAEVSDNPRGGWVPRTNNRVLLLRSGGKWHD